MKISPMLKDFALSPSLLAQPWTLDQAQVYCKKLAKQHYENFTVGSLFIPFSLRQHMYNVYAFCRISDDLGDEIGNQQRSLRLLSQWEDHLDQCYRGAATHPVFIALQRTIKEFNLPKEPFWRLIQAFKQDQLKIRHETFEELLLYCNYSANPVGHLVLYLFGYRDPFRQKLSDFTCTALQLANFWQDIARDYAMGRIYLPRQDMKRFDVTEEDIANRSATSGFKALLDYEVKQTKEMFYKGFELIHHVQGIFKIDLEAFNLGGLAILNGIEKINYEVLKIRPVVSRWQKIKILFLAFSHFMREK